MQVGLDMWKLSPIMVLGQLLVIATPIKNEYHLRTRKYTYQKTKEIYKENCYSIEVDHSAHGGVTDSR